MDATPRFPHSIVPVLIVAAIMAGCADEETRWRNAQEENSVSAYEEFLSAFPDGVFADSVRLGIEAIRFNTATSKGSIVAYEEFLVLYPHGVFADSARLGIETTHFNTAASEGSIVAYEEFLVLYPHGVFADSARLGIETTHFNTAASGGGIAALEEFQAMFPEGAFADSVRQVLDSLLPLEPQLSSLAVLNAQRDGCRTEFTVSVSHRSGTFGPERPQSQIVVRFMGEGWSLSTAYFTVDDVVSDNANHTTLRDIYEEGEGHECSGEVTFEVGVTDADGHESNKVQALVDFGQG